MLSIESLQNTLCLGVAGNFAGHLEQAGENADFVNVVTREDQAPKGIFPYYVPKSENQLGVFPLSDTVIRYPEELADEAYLQAEPEVSVVFSVKYEFGKIAELTPIAFAAFNDCSIRKPGAKKISEKKNWGEETKGVSANFIPVNTLSKGGELENYRIASYLIRDGECYEYGINSAVNGYTYFHTKLQDWMQDTLNHQGDFGPLENLNQIMHQCAFPKQIMISLGATAYTDVGERIFLDQGDEVKIYLYDGTQNSAEQVTAHANGEAVELTQASILEQVIK